jgi:internalin A
VDPQLEAAVRDSIGKPTGELLFADIEGSSFLSAVGYDIVDLSGLECWSHLRVLDLYENDLSGANATTAIASLTQLESLYLGCAGVETLDEIEHHPTLETLSVSAVGCPGYAPDLGVLSTLTRLKSLDVSEHAAFDVTALSNLKALEEVFAPGTQLADISALTNLPLLQRLVLSDNGISNVSPLSGLQYLSRLSLDQNDISSFDALSGLVSLKDLVLNTNAISDLPDLASFPALREIELSENAISDLQELTSLDSVSYVGLASNEVESLSALVDSQLKGTLNVQMNDLDCDDEADNILALNRQGLQVFCE